MAEKESNTKAGCLIIVIITVIIGWFVYQNHLHSIERNNDHTVHSFTVEDTFTDEHHFKFGTVNKTAEGNHSVIGNIGKADSDRYVVLELDSTSRNELKNATMSVELKQQNGTLDDKDINLFVALLDLACPGLENKADIVKKGVADILATKPDQSKDDGIYTINADGYKIDFGYVKDAGDKPGFDYVLMSCNSNLDL